MRRLLVAIGYFTLLPIIIAIHLWHGTFHEWLEGDTI